MPDFWRGMSHAYGHAADLEELVRLAAADFLRSAYPSYTSPSFLELGCGNGAILAKLRAAVPGARLMGVDDSRDMLAVARTVLGSSSDLVCEPLADFVSDPRNAARFEAAISCNTLHNLHSREAITAFFRSVGSVIRPGGHLICDIRNRFNPFISRGYAHNRSKGLDFHTFSPWRAMRILRRNGFEIVRCTPIRYRSLSEAGKDSLGGWRRVAYRAYLGLSRFSFFAPYVLIIARKRPCAFVEIAVGYHGQLFSLSSDENYHLHALRSARRAGFDPLLYAVRPEVRISDDPQYDGFPIIEYQNPFQHLLFLWSHRHDAVYATTLVWQSMIAPFICLRTVFMAHDSVRRKRAWKQLVQDIVFRMCKKVRVVTPEEKEFLVGRGFSPQKIAVVPLVIDSVHFRDRGALAREGIVFLGNVTPDKDALTILRALAIVKRSFPDVVLYLIGEVRDPSFEPLIRSLSLERSVVLRGFVPHSRLPEELSRGYLYVNSSISEGQCIAAYEAAACGLCLCLPRTLSFSGVFRTSALFHDPHDARALAENMISYLRNPALAREHAARAREIVVRECGTEAVARQEAALFSSL